MIRVIIIFAVLFSKFCYAEEIIASLDLKFVKDTEKTAAVLCYDEEEKNCQTWATFYLYKANVKKVLSGEIVEKKFTVIYGRHALRKTNYNNVLVRLEKLSTDADAQYQILEFSQNFELACFKSSEFKNLDSKLEIYNEKLKCAEKQEL